MGPRIRTGAGLVDGYRQAQAVNPQSRRSRRHLAIRNRALQSFGIFCQNDKNLSFFAEPACFCSAKHQALIKNNNKNNNLLFYYTI
jgi:hypothetical protein